MADYWGPFLQGLSYLESNNNPNEGNPMQNGRPMSSAQGAFQYINGTAKQAMNAGLPDPRVGDLNQQSAVTQSFIRKFLPKGAAAIDNGDYATAFRELRSTWPSLPGGSQQQNPERYAQFQKILGGNVPMPENQPNAAPVMDPVTRQLLQGVPPQQGQYNPMNSDWGSALQSAGAALAAASNPQAAYALSSLAKQSREALTEQMKLGKPEYKVLDDGSVIAIGPNGQAVPIYQSKQKMEKLNHSNIFGETWQTLFNPYTKEEGGIVGDGPMMTDDKIKELQDLRDSLEAQGKSTTEIKEAVLKAAPAALRDVTRGVLEGRDSVQHMGMASKARLPILGIANIADRNFTEQTYQQRQTLMNDYAKNNPSTEGGAMKAGDTLARHLGEGPDVYAKLGNTGLPAWDAVRNRFNTELGSPAQREFATWANTFGAEGARYLSGKAPSDAARGEILGNLRAADSPQQFADVVSRYAKMFNDKHGAYVDNWKAIMNDPEGKTLPFKENQGLWSKTAQDNIDKISKLNSPSPGFQNPNVPAKDQGQVPTMQKRYDLKLKKFVPVETANPNAT